MRKTSRFRLTIRARITLSVALLVALGGGVIVAGLNIFMRYGPVWAIPASATVAASSSATTDNNIGGSAVLNVDTSGAGATDREGFTETVPALEIRTVDDVFDTLLWSSIVALVLIVVAGALAAWILAGRVLSPLHEINAAARSATPSRLDRRVALQGPRDELTDLSDTLDAMLDRLEQAFRAQQLFAANASHELRTPLATEKAMLDMLLDGPEPSAAEYREVAVKLRDVNARSIAMGEALLDLTRSQMGVGVADRSEHEPQDVTDLLEAPLARAREVAVRRGLTVEAAVEPHSVNAQPRDARKAARQPPRQRRAARCRRLRRLRRLCRLRRLRRVGGRSG